MIDDNGLNLVFNNYSKLVEKIQWRLSIDYSKLFNEFKLIPNDFFNYFNNIACLVIDRVDNYSHLFQFLKYCPILESVILDNNYSKVDTNLILGQIFILSPSLRMITFKEDKPSNFKNYNFSFLYLLANLNSITFMSSSLPIRLIKEIAKKNRNGCEYILLKYTEIDLIFSIKMTDNQFHLTDSTHKSRIQSDSIDKIIDFLQNDHHLSQYL